MKVKVPAPVLIKEPVELAAAPFKVRLLPAVLTSMVDEVASLRVNARSIATLLPVYFKVPPPKIKLPALALAAPMPLAAPPSAKLATLNTPSLMVVTPV